MAVHPLQLIFGRTASHVNKPVLVDDDGKLIVDVSVSSSGSAIEDGVDSAIKATVRNYVGSNPLAVVLTDLDGDPYVASGGSIGAVDQGDAGVDPWLMTVPDGADIALGTTSDVASATTVIGRLQKLISLLPTALSGGKLQVIGPLTDTELRASSVNVNITGSSGSQAVTVADGDDVAEGAIANTAVTGDNAGTVSAKLRGLNLIWADVWDSVAHRIKTSAVQSGSWVLSAGSAIIGKVGIDQTTPGTTNGVVVNSSALPTGASTAAKQPALGTAGTPSADIISIQGHSSMTPVDVNVLSGGFATTPFGDPLPADAVVVAIAEDEFGNVKPLNVDIDGNLGIVGLVSINHAFPGDSDAVTLLAGTQVIGHVISDTGSTTEATQATAANLKAQVVGAGTAGTANAGVVTVQGIAAMVPLLVTPSALPANQSVNLAQVNGQTVNVGAGNAGTGTQRVSISTDDVNLAAINAVSGTTAGAAVITDINGTIQQYLRGLIKLAITAGGFLVTLSAGTALVGKVVAAQAYDVIFNGTTPLTPKFAKISASSSGVNIVVAAVTSKKIVVTDVVLMANAAVNVKFQSHTTPTDLTGLLYLAANTGFAPGYDPTGHFESLAGESLDINLSGAVAVGGWLKYIEV